MIRFNLVLLGSLLALASSSRADIVFTDFGAGNTYNHPLSTAVNDNEIGFQEVAMPFTPTASAKLTNAIVAFGYGTPGASAIFRVYTDASGVPGTVLASAPVLTPTQAQQDPTSDINTVDFSSSNLQLVAGTKYWLDADPTTGGSTGWNETASGTATIAYRNSAGAGWSEQVSTPSAFNINGVVPEPGSALLFAVSGLVLSARRRARV